MAVIGGNLAFGILGSQPILWENLVEGSCERSSGKMLGTNLAVKFLWKNLLGRILWENSGMNILPLQVKMM